MSKSKPTPEVAELNPAPTPRTVRIDESRLTATYVNLFRVVGTADELVIDAGFHAAAGSAPPSVISVTQRLIVNWPAAKRLLQTLEASVAARERNYGPITDAPQRRTA